MKEFVSRPSCESITSTLFSKSAQILHASHPPLQCSRAKRYKPKGTSGIPQGIYRAAQVSQLEWVGILVFDRGKANGTANRAGRFFIGSRTQRSLAEFLIHIAHKVRTGPSTCVC